MAWKEEKISLLHNKESAKVIAKSAAEIKGKAQNFLMNKKDDISQKKGGKRRGKNCALQDRKLNIVAFKD